MKTKRAANMKIKRVAAIREAVAVNDSSDPAEGSFHGIPNEVEVGGSPLYKVEKPLGRGSFGQVFLGRRVSGGDEKIEGSEAMEVALKFEHINRTCHVDCPPKEWQVYDNLAYVDGVPKVHYKGKQGKYNIMVMDILGPNLREVWKTSGEYMSDEMVACVAVKTLSILSATHSKGYVHGDIKPDNILLGQQSSSQEKKLFLVDFGLAIKWRDSNYQHVEYAQSHDRFRGTIDYASIHAHLGRTPSRRDDLESLAYTLVFLVKGRLPWQKIWCDKRVAETKMLTSPKVLCRYCPAPFKEFLETVISLKFDEEPNYFKLISIFQSLIEANPSIRPLSIDGADKIIPVEDQDNEPPRKKVRYGLPESQWISVYNIKKHIMQRYLNNLTDEELDVLVKQGHKDGLFISSVASYSNLWTVVMDKETSFTDQVYKIAPCFLHKDWITERWHDGYNISSLAGAMNGRSLVVMSKGTSYADQCYTVSSSFPFIWIKERWRQGLYVTSMATCMATIDTYWIVVMSRCSEIINQVVELDFVYPSEGIHNYWEKGYRITSIAATKDQVVVILSKHSWGSGERQETSRSSQLLGETIQRKWENNRYLSCFCYQRTLC